MAQLSTDCLVLSLRKSCRQAGNLFIWFMLWGSLFGSDIVVRETGSGLAAVNGAPWLSPLRPFKLRRIPFCASNADCSLYECCVLDYSNNMPVSMGGLPAVYKRCQPLSTYGQPCSRAKLLQVRQCGCSSPFVCAPNESSAKKATFFNHEALEDEPISPALVLPFELSSKRQYRKLFRYHKKTKKVAMSSRLEDDAAAYESVDVDGVCIYHFQLNNSTNDVFSRTTQARLGASTASSTLPDTLRAKMSNFLLEASFFDELANKRQRDSLPSKEENSKQYMNNNAESVALSARLSADAEALDGTRPLFEQNPATYQHRHVANLTDERFYLPSALLKEEQQPVERKASSLDTIHNQRDNMQNEQSSLSEKLTQNDRDAEFNYWFGPLSERTTTSGPLKSPKSEPSEIPVMFRMGNGALRRRSIGRLFKFN